MVAMMARDLRRLEGGLRRLEEDLRRSRMIRGLEWSHLVVTRPKTGCSQSSLLSSIKWQKKRAKQIDTYMNYQTRNGPHVGGQC